MIVYYTYILNVDLNSPEDQLDGLWHSAWDTNPLMEYICVTHLTYVVTDS